MIEDEGVVAGVVMEGGEVEAEADEAVTAAEERVGAGAVAAAAAAVAAATSKLQRTPACRHLEQEGLMRSHRRLK